MPQIIPMQPVRHLPRAIAFYEKLGFNLEDRRDDWGWAKLRWASCAGIVSSRARCSRPRDAWGCTSSRPARSSGTPSERARGDAATPAAFAAPPPAGEWRQGDGVPVAGGKRALRVEGGADMVGETAEQGHGRGLSLIKVLARAL